MQRSLASSSLTVRDGVAYDLSDSSITSNLFSGDSSADGLPISFTSLTVNLRVQLSMVAVAIRDFSALYPNQGILQDTFVHFEMQLEDNGYLAAT